MKVQQTLEGDLVRLLPIGEEHQEATRRWANAPELQRCMLRSSYVNEEDQRNWLLGLERSENKVAFGIHAAADGRHIGNAGLYEISSQHKRAEFWILLGDPAARGRGCGSEATRLLLEYGFSRLGLNRIHLIVHTGNTAAIASYKKCGFIQEGLLREYSWVHGAPMDVFMMSILTPHSF